MKKMTQGLNGNVVEIQISQECTGQPFVLNYPDHQVFPARFLHITRAPRT
ncbi:MAG: hypothetical protein KAX55_09925 [Propionivibrio sp.]|nr:hypothetical protein [Propionivibrio sp.]